MRRKSAARFRVSRPEAWLAPSVLHEGELAAGDADPVSELIESHASRGAKVPNPLAEGHKIVHGIRIAKDRVIFHPNF